MAFWRCAEGSACGDPGAAPGGGSLRRGCWRRPFCALCSGLGDEGLRTPTADILGAVAIASLLLQPTDALIQSGLETVQAISDYGKLLLPGDVGGPGASVEPPRLPPYTWEPPCLTASSQGCWRACWGR